MADELNQNGLTLDNYTTLLENIQSAMNEIYATDGESINFNSETPDGQFTNILAQIGTDARQLAMDVYNSFNPDNCNGIVQDQRYALNYITRKGGTYTIQNIDIVTNQTVTLQGLDGNYNDENGASYTVSDDAGNLWYLIDTSTITAGTTSLPFRSQNLGLVQPTIGTITTQVTKVLGVVSVNNSVAPTTYGEEQETNAEFRIRRERSTATRGQNNYDAMIGQILELDGVTDAKIFVNNTNVTNTDVTGDLNNGVPAFNVWVIVEGGSQDDIANVIYQNSSGLATFGYENQLVTPAIEPIEVNTITVSGQTYSVKFNRVNPVPLYIQFDLKIAETGITVNEDLIREYIVGNLLFKLNQNAETSYVTDIASQSLLQFNASIYALNVEISLDGTTWVDFLPSTSWMNKFVVDTSRITITQV
jgi:copper chaperone CopZ